MLQPLHFKDEETRPAATGELGRNLLIPSPTFSVTVLLIVRLEKRRNTVMCVTVILKEELAGPNE